MEGGYAVEEIGVNAVGVLEGFEAGVRRGVAGGARVNGVLLDAHIMHNACTGRMRAVRARAEG